MLSFLNHSQRQLLKIAQFEDQKKKKNNPDPRAYPSTELARRRAGLRRQNLGSVLGPAIKPITANLKPPMSMSENYYA